MPYTYVLDVLVGTEWALELRSDFAPDIAPTEAAQLLLRAYFCNAKRFVPCSHCGKQHLMSAAKGLLMQHRVDHPTTGAIVKMWSSIGFACPDTQACLHDVATRVRIRWKSNNACLQAEGDTGKMFRICHTCKLSEATVPKGTPTFQVCGRCKNVHYCSVTCQRADWAAHKAYCVVDNKIL
jgi:hypothetical protein